MASLEKLNFEPCKICSNLDSLPKQQLRSKGAKSLNRLKGDSTYFKEGDYVHIKCRKSFSKKTDNEGVASGVFKTSSPVKRRSSAPAYNCLTDCFYCTIPITEKEIYMKKSHEVLTVDIFTGIKQVSQGVNICH